MNEKEKILIKMVLEGDMSAFEPLVKPYRDLLLNLAFRFSRDPQDAQDIAQETLLRTFKYLQKYDQEKSFKNWILQILVNEARIFRKRRKRMEALPAYQNKMEQDDPMQKALREEFHSHLLQCLDELSDRQREVFLLRDIEELSIKETSQILGCSSISVRVHLSAARKKIKDIINEIFPQQKGDQN